MNRKFKFLIISIIIIAGIVLGVNYISNAAVFGDELVNIEKMVGDVVKTYKVSSGTSAGALLEKINTEFTKYNKAGEGAPKPEEYIENNVYCVRGIFCVRHQKSLKGYSGQCIDVNHGGSYNLYYNASTNSNGKVVFDKTTPYLTDPKLKTNPTVWKTVYEAGTDGKCCKDPATQTVYSNFNAIQIYSGDLHSINTHYTKYNKNHRIPYIISFYDGIGTITNATDAQNALWGFTGSYSDSCHQHSGYCSTLPEETLHKAGIAVEQYMNVEKNHGTTPQVSLPANAQAGAAYFSYGSDDFDEVIDNMEEGLKKNLETQKVISDGIVRIGPFVMSDYAYAFSEHVANYSNKDLEWPQVVAGIVEGKVTIDGREIPIVAKEEGENYIHSSGGTVLSGTEGASIVYKDWYNQVPIVYAKEADVRGDASREYSTTLNGKETEILYKPIISNTAGANAGEYSTGFETTGSLQLLSGEAKATEEHLKVKIKDENGNYTVDYPFPLPNSVFYIEVPVSLCGTAESILTDITFTYRETESTGTGDVIITRAAKSTIKFNKSEYSGSGDITTDATKCSTYYCQNHTPSYATHYSSNYGGYHTCYYHWTCDDNDWKGCKCAGGHCSGHKGSCDCDLAEGESCSSDHTEYCDSWGCDRLSDCHCSCKGHTDSHWSLFLCTHGHSKCENGYWILKDSEITTEYGQPILIVNEAKTEVKENKVSSGFEVRVLERINTEMSIICVWHGWDAKFNRGSNVGEILDDNGFFDGKTEGILGDINWGQNTIKSAELGDRIVYRAVVKHTSTEPMWIWVRIKYPDSMKADDITSPEVYQDAPDAFYEGRYGTTYQNGGWFSVLGSTTADGEQIGAIKPKDLTVDGASRTKSAKLFVKNGSGYAFFFEYTFTKEIGTKTVNGKTISNTPTLQITSLDYKWKILDDVNKANVNIDFNRVRGPGATWMGPVITSIVQKDQEMIVKRYVVNLNKYIYNVDHKNTIGTDTTTVHNETTRGYEFYNSDSTNKYSYNELIKTYEKQESKKEASPVYVEYGDRITYKIEVGNGKVTERDTVADFDYNVDEMFITLKDQLPKKYSNLDIQIEAWGYTKAGVKITETQGAHFTMPNYPTEWDSDTEGPTIEFKDLLIPRNGVTTITVSFDIEEYEKGTIEQNKAYVYMADDAKVYDYNRGRGATPWDERTSNVKQYTVAIGESSDWYILNDYKIDIDKYISSYKSTVHESNEALGFTQESPKINANGIENGLSAGSQSGNEDMQRMDLTYNQKINSPVAVEKSDKLIYSIKLENLANATKTNKASIRGNKPATQVRVSKIRETMHSGLKYLDVKAYIYSDSGAKVRDVTAYVDHVDTGGNVHEFKLDHVADTLIEANEFIVFYIEVEVTESNMSLEKLFNNADLVTLSNINSPNDKNTDSSSKEARLVKTEPGVHEKEYDENTSNVETSSEFVKMKDLVISGKVWLDKDRDGQMETEDYNLLSDEEKNRYDIKNGEAGKSGIVVRLYREDGTLERTTVTDDNGLYTFSRSLNVNDSTDRNNLSSAGWCEDSFNATTSPDGSIQYSDSTDYQRIDKATGKDQYGNYTSGSQFINYYIEFEYDGILYKSTEVYSTGKYPVTEDQGMTNLTGNGDFNDLYKTDSNAYEKNSERERFNQLYEYISYNSAYDINKANKSDLVFDKDGHVSLLVEDKERVVRSRSFINNKTDADNYLWLYDYQGTGATYPNTEYLKYINLGLELREEVDIALTKDVYKVKTTINGETMEYDFNQNAGLNGVDSGLGGTQTGSGEYLNDFIIKKAYGLEIYEYDYKYRVDQYFADEVRNYKGIESELNIEVTYRITIDNKAISDADDVIADGKDYVTDNKLKVKVNEIMDVYETNFIKLGARPNDEITIKTKDDKGYLVDTKIKTIEAWYFKEDANGNYKVANDTSSGEKPIYIETATGGTHVKVPLTISANSAFTNNNISYEDYGYNKLYITGMENEDILEDKDLDIYIKYTLDKDETEISVDVSTYEETTTSSSKVLGSAELGDAYGTYTQTIKVNKTTGKATMQRSLKIQDPVTNKPRTNNRYLENIAQVNAYSVWYMDNKPASLVDRNSNVGNLGANGKSPDDISEYDDTTYKTGVEIKVCSSTNIDGGNSNEVIGGQIEISTKPRIERIISGKVWDDSRTTTLGSGNEVQYIGDGVYDESIPKQADALMNENVELNYEGAGTTVTEEKDFPIRNVKAEFIEIVKMPDPSGTGERYYEQVLQQVTWKQVQNTRTASDGTYELLGFIPGTYIVRFTYGDTATGTAEKDMQIFNGQDYKSTQYNSELSDNETDIDKILAILEKVGKSDARDDERRRLEVNSYSEVMTNAKAEILKGVGNGTRLTPNSIANTADELKELTDKTYMQSETVEFLVKAEKLTEEQQGLTKYLSLSSKALGIDEIFYSELQAIQKEERDTRDFKITNIDLGIEYRPESEIRLVKEIEEVKLITEDGNTLVDLFFLTEGENENTTHKIDTTKSKGLEVVQFITNTYTNELLNRLTNEKKQGFIFVQVDEEVLQGCTVQISYKFEAENNSEVDRIAVNLDEIRYKENPEAIKLIAEYPKVATQAEGDYTASAVAAKVIESDMYRTVTQDGVEIEYRLRPKTVVTEGLSEAEEKEAYFGRYVGYGYYTGKESNLDTIASLKFDKILDYVDVNLEYKQESEQSNTIDKFWTRVKTNDLKTLLYQVRTSTENPVAELQNGRGYDYKTLIVSVDDRIKDDKYSTRYSSFKINSETDNIRNNDLSRFLLPKVTVENEAEEDKAVATIRLPVSKVLSAETDKDNMSYENFAEIVQFTTLTGRRTNFATTIGNADIEKVTPNERKGTLEFVTASLESDTAATETVTLIPPTGLMKNRLAIVNIVEATSVGVGFIFILGTIAVILIIIITAILFIIRKYKKRRII